MSRIVILCFTIFISVSTQSHPGGEAKLAFLDQKITEDPYKQSLYINRGATYTHLGKYHLAMTDFTHAKTLGKSNLVDNCAR